MRCHEMEECYELSLTPNYVSDWTFCYAIRELIQNGTDQEIIDESNTFSLTYLRYENKLILRNEKSFLKINTLLLGSSSKSNNNEVVGKFGEGYKIAALVLNRLGKKITIYNNENNEIWEARFKDSEKWHEKVLSFYISKNETSDSGLDIIVEHVSEAEYARLKDVWLELNHVPCRIKTEYGEILLGEEGDFNPFSGKVYVNGLAVSYSGELEYGYNFKPQYITLERDRRSCNNWDAKVITSKMICEAMVKGSLSIKQVGALVIKNADDIYQLDVIDGGNPDKVKRLLIEEFDRQNPTSYSIPVSTQEHADIVRRYGGNPVIVPQTFASAIRREIDRRMEALISAPMSNGLTLKEKFQRWCDLYGAKAGCIPQEELQNLIDELN